MKDEANTTAANPLDDLSVKKVRRRIEDVLRKSNPKVILGVAQFMGVNTEVTKEEIQHGN
jgi:hypothetical protein